jgi:dsRNA-specific ribonuclease
MDVTSEFLKRVFSHANLKENYLKMLTENPESLRIFQAAFTSKTVDPENNYELYEFIGDLEANNAIVWYFYESFPQLRCTKSVKIFNRLKIVYVSNESFSEIADSLGFWPYIKYDRENDKENKTREALLEDVFEAFVGATKIILTNEFGMVGVANQIIYNFIKPIFDKKEISFAPENLYDAKTRLKELFDNRTDANPLFVNYGNPKYEELSNTETVLYFVKDKRLKFYGEGRTKQVREKNAAQKALDHLKSQGYKIEKQFVPFCA